jgi:hypothetical protein
MSAAHRAYEVMTRLADELTEKALAAEKAGLYESARKLWSRAGRATPPGNMLRKTRLDRAKTVGKPKPWEKT